MINYKAKEDAEFAQTHMNNGQIDGMIISVKVENPAKSEEEAEKS